jgi:hypothetical protein
MLPDNGDRNDKGELVTSLDENELRGVWLCSNPSCGIKMFRAIFVRFPHCEGCGETPTLAVTSMNYTYIERFPGE